MLRSWRGAVRVAARIRRPPISAHLIDTNRRLPVVQARSFSVQQETQTVVFSQANAIDHPAFIDASALPPSPPASTHKPSNNEPVVRTSIRACERVLAAPESSYGEALRAFEYLRKHRARLNERHYLSLLEKASVEQHYSAIRSHFKQFCDALAQNKIKLYRSPKSTWRWYQSERLQIHRHVLWAILQSCPANSRFRKMQGHFRKFELGTTRNRLDLYEADSLNFLLRMECTFTFVDPLARNQGAMSWLMRVTRILDELQKLRFHTDYSSCHALFHFLMSRPDVVLGESVANENKVQDEIQAKQRDEVAAEVWAEDQLSVDQASAEVDRNEDDNDNAKPASMVNAEDDAIFDLLNTIFDKYPQVVERDSRRISIAVSTAASTNRLWLAVQLLRDADIRGIAVDAVSFAHVVAMSSDENTRLAIADLYMRAKDQDRLLDESDDINTKHALKRHLLRYAIHDGNFTQIMELLHEMEYSNITAPPSTVAMLFGSIAKHRAKIRNSNRSETERRLTSELNKCPTVLQLLNNFPTAIDRNAHTGTHGVLQALRGGDIDVALTVLRTTVQHTKVPLRAEVFSQVLYAVLVSAESHSCDIIAVREVEQLFDTRHPGKRDLLNAQLLNLCESNHDLETMVAVLDNWHADVREPLSKRALQRVFDVISSQLRAIRKQEKKAKTQAAAVSGQQSEEVDNEEEEEAEVENVRYKLGNLELSFRGVLEKYPMLVPLNASTLNLALMRSATMQLVDDVATLLSVAHSKQFAIEPVVYKAALDVLHEAVKAQGVESSARAAMREIIYSMKMSGSWEIISQQYPEFAAKLQDE